MSLRKHCDHCGVEIGSAVPLDVAQVEPVAKAWPGGNLVVRVMFDRCEDPHDCTRWAPLDLCRKCFNYVLTEAVQALHPEY
jgi:hypothetical protein